MRRGTANIGHVAPELVDLVRRAYKADPVKTEAELNQLDRGLSRRNYGSVDWGMILIDAKSQTD